MDRKTIQWIRNIQTDKKIRRRWRDIRNGQKDTIQCCDELRTLVQIRKKKIQRRKKRTERQYNELEHTDR